MRPRQRGHLPHLPPARDIPIIFLTAVTHGRRGILASDLVHDVLRTIWERSSVADGWLVGSYVVMPDHVHLFAAPAACAIELSKWIKMWKSVSARAVIPHVGERPIWQRDYFDRFLRSEESYSGKWDYVRNNPVRAGLVHHADEWPYRGTIHQLEW